MGLYKHLRELWRKPDAAFSEVLRQRLIEWSKEAPATVRLERPTRIDRARSLGYKAKQGFVVVRQRVERGGRKRPDIKGARRSKHSGQRKDLNMSYQVVAERRAAMKYPNLEVLNSYYLAKKGRHYWFEVILVDKQHPSIKNDKDIGWIAEPQHRRRVFRGLTSAEKKSRGLRHKGIGAEKLRPSLRAHERKGT